MGLCKALVKLGRGKDAVARCTQVLEMEESQEALEQVGFLRIVCESADWRNLISDGTRLSSKWLTNGVWTLGVCLDRILSFQNLFECVIWFIHADLLTHQYCLSLLVQEVVWRFTLMYIFLKFYLLSTEGRSKVVSGGLGWRCG